MRQELGLYLPDASENVLPSVPLQDRCKVVEVLTYMEWIEPHHGCKTPLMPWYMRDDPTSAYLR